MRTTINMDEDLHAAVKARATAEEKSMTSFVDGALRRYLATTVPVDVPITLDGSIMRRDGVFPGVDLDDAAALFDLMSTR